MTTRSGPEPASPLSVPFVLNTSVVPLTDTQIWLSDETIVQSWLWLER